jgi:hyperosmotically inducible protein
MKSKELIMKNRLTYILAVLALAVSMGAAALLAQEQAVPPPAPSEKAIIEALLHLPHYGVFDNLAFQLDGPNVTLFGQVMLPITKQEAGRQVAALKGVGKVINSIEVLPLSPSDDAIRMTVYRRLFNSANLYRYALGPIPSIHIIVKGGHVTLEGMVSTAQDKDFAGMVVKGIPGIFSVINNLKIADKIL